MAVTSKNNLRKGSSGNDVTELQKLLNSTGYGYNLAEDGIFGDKTLSAVKDYQQRSGLSVDGIVGTNTWGKLTEATQAPAQTETKAPTFEYTAYEDPDIVKQAYATLEQQLANKPGEYQSAWQTQLNDTLQKILNREKFSYDLNGDMLYQQYKDQYTTQGKLASMDVMGQAAAMTGGYGNSYAQTAGQQAYQGYLQQLNDKVPELYQLALNQYNAEGDEMYNQASLMAQMDEQEYGRYRDKVSDYYTELNRLTEDARYKGEDAYKKWADTTNLDYSIFSDQRAYDYQVERDKIADQQWQATFDEGVRQYNTSLSKSSGSGSGGSGNGGGDEDTSGVSDNIISKVSGFENNDDLANYIDGLTASGSITEEQADALYAEYRQPDQAALNNRSWTLVDDGGVNWFWGIDNNATVKDQYGNTYRLDKLVDALVAEGMSKSDAKTYVKNLQAKLGA